MGEFFRKGRETAEDDRIRDQADPEIVRRLDESARHFGRNEPFRSIQEARAFMDSLPDPGGPDAPQLTDEENAEIFYEADARRRADELRNKPKPSSNNN